VPFFHAHLLLASIAVGSAPSLSLAEALLRATDTSPTAELIRAQVRVAKGRVIADGALPNPQLVLGGAPTSPHFSAGLQAKLPIFGQRGAQIAAAEAAAIQSEAEVRAQLAGLRRDARIAYYAAARLDEERRIAAELERLTGIVENVAKERYETGAGNGLDAAQASLAHLASQREVADRASTSRIAKLELARLLGALDTAERTLADPLARVGSTPSDAVLLGAALDRHPQVLAGRRAREAALARVRSARAARRPTLTAELGLSMVEADSCGGDSRCVRPYGVLAIPLPTLDLNRGPIEIANAEAQMAAASITVTRQRIEVEARVALDRLRAAGERARFFDDEYLPAAQRVESMAEEGFRAGRTGLLPLVEAQRALQQAKLGRTGAWGAVQEARALLEEATGVELSAP